MLVISTPLQTIVECLKQATTGELPPNSNKGQSFIFDPKVLELHCMAYRELFH
jgi:hypothetical protein